MRAIKEEKHLTNAYVAEKADVSVKTIERIMALNCDQDIMRDTARRIELVIMGDSTDYPCYLALEEHVPEVSTKLNDALRELERALVDKEDYRLALDKIHETHAAEMQTINAAHALDLQALRDDSAAKIDYLLRQLEHVQRDNDYLWTENNRKARIIDRIIDNGNIQLVNPSP